MKTHILGVGGVFFKSKDPQALYRWYEEVLGLKREDDSAIIFRWGDSKDAEQRGITLFSAFQEDTQYFDPTTSSTMINFRVRDLDGLLESLKEKEVWIAPNREDSEFGRFAWIRDPEGRKIELWEPPQNQEGCY